MREICLKKKHFVKNTRLLIIIKIILIASFFLAKILMSMNFSPLQEKFENLVRKVVYFKSLFMPLIFVLMYLLNPLLPMGDS